MTDILLFPLDRRVGKIRHTAEKLAGKYGEDATLYWKQVVAANRKALERLDLDEGVIDAELRAFFEAVQSELTRLTRCDQRGGAA